MPTFFEGDPAEMSGSFFSPEYLDDRVNKEKQRF